MIAQPKIDRRGWLSWFLQKRRRERVPAVLLASDGHGHLTWTWNFTSPYDSVNIYKSTDGVTWGSNPYDGWDLLSGARDCSGDAGYFRICVCDDNGVDVPPYSNAVYSDGL